MNQTILGDLIKEVKIMSGKRYKALAAGRADLIIQEGLSGLCRHSAIWVNTTIRAMCEHILDENEDHLALNLLAYARNRTLFDLTNRICHETTVACPKNVHSASLHTEIQVPKAEVWSERPDRTAQKHFKKFVASTWNEDVVDFPGDVVTFQYQHELWAEPDRMDRYVVQLLQETAELLRECETISTGTINLGMNDLPYSFASFLKPKTLALWGSGAKEEPVFKKDLRDGDLTGQDLLDFIRSSASHQESRACLLRVMDALDAATQVDLQSRKFPWREEI